MFKPSNTADLLSVAAAKWPDGVALVDRNETLYYGELLDRARQHAHRLGNVGIERGARIAVVVDKSVEVVSFVFGCLLAGVVVVPINPRLKQLQVEHMLTDSDAILLAIMEGRQSFHEVMSLPGLGIVLLRPGDAPDIRLAPKPCSAHEWNIEPATGFQDLAMLFYTSGSTGMPKAVMCRHLNLLSGAASVASYLENTKEDRILAILALSFDAGFSQLTTGFLSGAMVILRDYILPSDISRACEEYGVTGITGVPAIWKAALAVRWSDVARHKLRYFANTGGHLPEMYLNRLQEIFPNASPYLMYGLTEAFRSTYLKPAHVTSRPDSIGKAIPGARVVVVDAHGEECRPGEIGELVHAGPTVAAGYWKSPEATAHRFRMPPPCLQREGIAGPVVYSGDMVRRDEDGFLYFVSRGDRQIKILGNRVSLTEIENTALLCDGVIASVASALPGEDGADPTIVLFYIARPGSNVEVYLKDWCRSELPSFMVPGEFVRRTEFLLTPNGKYDLDAMLLDRNRHEPIGA